MEIDYDTNPELAKYFARVKGAVSSEETEFLAKELADNPDLVNWVSSRDTLLSTACSSQKWDTAKLLIEVYHAPIDGKPGVGDPILPLENTCGRGNLEFVRYLLEHGADPNLGRPAVAAVNSRRPDSLAIIDLMVKHGLNINNKFDMFGDFNNMRTVLDFVAPANPLYGELVKRGAKHVKDLK